MRKRSSYRPKPVFVDPLGFVLESNKPLKEHDSYVIDWKIKNTVAYGALLRGEATRQNLDTLVAARNICEALLVVFKVKEDDGTLARSACALIEICERYAEGKRALKAPEIQALRDMMQLHDELLDLSSVGQFEKALAYAKKEIRSGKAQQLKEVK
jgi:hypothetical protein